MPDVAILGINAAGAEDGNEAFVVDLVLPWLQDDASQDVWSTWGVEYRDVVILDPDGRYFDTYNLTVADLSLPENQDALRSLLQEAEDGAPVTRPE